MVVVRRKRVLVPQERQKVSYQPRLDHVMLVMAHHVRVSVLEFLSHQRLMGDALQPFSAIQHAIDSKKSHLSTSDLDYHLKALIKAALIEKITNGDESAGYMLTEKGRPLVEKYLEMKNIQVEVPPELERNVLEDHVHEFRILELTRPIKKELHVMDIDFSPRRKEAATDRYLVDRAREAVERTPPPRPAKAKPQPPRDATEKKPRARKDTTGFSSLDSFR